MNKDFSVFSLGEILPLILNIQKKNYKPFSLLSLYIIYNITQNYRACECIIFINNTSSYLKYFKKLIIYFPN